MIGVFWGLSPYIFASVQILINEFKDSNMNKMHNNSAGVLGAPVKLPTYAYN